MQVFLGIVGALLLLPGVCGAYFMALVVVKPPTDGFTGLILMIAIPSFLLGIFGVWLLRRVIRRNNNPPAPPG